MRLVFFGGLVLALILAGYFLVSIVGNVTHMWG